MVKFLLPRISDRNTLVPVVIEDKGDVVPAFDAEGRQFRAFTTYFYVDGSEEFYNQTSVAAMEASGDPFRFRANADMIALEAHDLEFIPNADVVEVSLDIDLDAA